VFQNLLKLAVCTMLFISCAVFAKAPKFDARKVDSYQKECTAKNASGCFFLGVAYFLGEVMPKDDEEALKYLQMAQELEPKNPIFLSTIGKLHYYDYKTGNDKQNLDKAMKLFNRACRYGEFDSCNVLGSIYEYGDGDIEINYEMATLYYQKSCELKNLDGCDKLRNVKNRE
jgi:TPR repeat protein